jgi:4-hydroxy-4-methyl-2-oxoglutarate aldolase
MKVVPPEVIVRLSNLPTATIYEAAGKLGDMSADIRPMVAGQRIAGQAFTLKTMPGDNLAVFKAIMAAPRGSVLVIDGGGTDRVTIWGGTSTVAAQMRGLSGCITNAAVRDLDEIIESSFPVFAVGVAVRGTTKSHPGWLGIPISVGGVIVNLGDVIVADADGVVVVDGASAAEIAKKAEIKRRDELDRERRLREGESLNAVMGF